MANAPADPDDNSGDDPPSRPDRRRLLDASEDFARDGRKPAARAADGPADHADGSVPGDSGGTRAGQHSTHGDAGERGDARADAEDDPRSASRDKSGKDDAGDSKGAKKRPNKRVLIILGVVVALLAIAALIYWFTHRNLVSTDDAFTDGNAVAISPKVSGYVSELLVSDNAFVHKGDVILRIDARDFNTSRDQARAELGLAIAELRSAETQLALAKVQIPARLAEALAQRETAQANLAKAAASAARQHNVDLRATSQENIDAADAQRKSAEASVVGAQAQVKSASLVPEQIRQVMAIVDERRQQVEQAKAKLAQTELSVSYTEVVAPSDGWVTRRNVQLGSFLQAGAQLMVLVSPDVWVTANFKESQLERMRPGDPVRIKVDAYPDLDLRGHVDSIQLGTGSRFSAFPAENATGNFVKIVQRVPVKILIDSGLDPKLPLPLGLSVVPTVELR